MCILLMLLEFIMSKYISSQVTKEFHTRKIKDQLYHRFLNLQLQRLLCSGDKIKRYLLIIQIKIIKNEIIH